MSNQTFLLIGVGRFGRHIAMKLNELGKQVMAVDKREDRLQHILSYVTSAQVGDCTDRDFLASLGVRNFDVCLVAIGDDFLASLEITSFLKELGAPKVVSRASRDTQAKFLLRNGADEVIYPEKEMGEWAAVKYANESFFDYMKLDEDYGVFEVAVPESWIGHTIGQLDVRRKYKMNIIAVKTGKTFDVATGAGYLLKEGQSLMVLGRTTDIARTFNVKE